MPRPCPRRRSQLQTALAVEGLFVDSNFSPRLVTCHMPLGFGGRRQRTRTRYRIHRGTIEELSHTGQRVCKWCLTPEAFYPWRCDAGAEDLPRNQRTRRFRWPIARSCRRSPRVAAWRSTSLTSAAERQRKALRFSAGPAFDRVPWRGVTGGGTPRSPAWAGQVSWRLPEG